MQEEPWPPDQALLEGRAGEAAQLPEGRTLHLSRRGSRHLHNHGALAGVEAVRPDPIPATLLQARHKAAHPRAREVERGILCQIEAEPEPKRRIGSY